MLELGQGAVGEEKEQILERVGQRLKSLVGPRRKGQLT